MNRCLTIDQLPRISGGCVTDCVGDGEADGDDVTVAHWELTASREMAS